MLLLLLGVLHLGKEEERVRWEGEKEREREKDSPASAAREREILVVVECNVERESGRRNERDSLTHPMTLLSFTAAI